MIEIERKFRLTPQQVTLIRKSLGDKDGSLEFVHQVDQVFLHHLSSFKDFRRGMPVVRLRSVAATTKLTYKRAINDSGDSVEYELMVSSATVMEKILTEIGYRQVTLVVKDRAEVSEGPLTLALDTVERLGDFLEIEILSDRDDDGQAESAILAKAAEFGLIVKNIEPRKYDELLETIS